MTGTHFIDPDAPTDPHAATAFLASFDDRDSIRRSALARVYIAADRPGGLTLDHLHKLAAQRWPTRSAKRPTYLPATATR